MIHYYLAALLAALALLCACCKVRKAGAEDLAAYVADERHGLHKEQTWRGIKLSLDYTPRSVVVRDMLGKTYNRHLGDSLVEALSDHVYLRFTFTCDGQPVTRAFADNLDRYEKAQEYLASTIGRDIHLLAADKSYDVYDFLYVPGDGLSGGSTVALVFKEIPEEIGDFQIIYEDRFFGTGTSVFDFNGDSIALSQDL